MAAQGQGSRFSILCDEGRKRDKREKKHDRGRASKPDSSDATADLQKNKKDKKKKKDTVDIAEVDADKKDRDTEAIFIIVVAALSGSDKYSKQSVVEAAEWLGIEYQGGTDRPKFGDYLPRMLRNLAKAVDTDMVPREYLEELLEIRSALEEKELASDAGVCLILALERQLCPGCKERIPLVAICEKCAGTRYAWCDRCDGTGSSSCSCKEGYVHCDSCIHGRAICEGCLSERLMREKMRLYRHRANNRRVFSTAHREDLPSQGVCIKPCDVGELSTLQSLWEDRGGSGEISSAWSIDNPRLSWAFHAQVVEVGKLLHRMPDELQAFHGTHPNNVLSICQIGFNSQLRDGQVFGVGEYFAKNPEVSKFYCKDGNYMLICRLCLGKESSDSANTDGDHIWVPERLYYVISNSAQVLPQFIIRFNSSRIGVRHTAVCEDLEKALSLDGWSTKFDERVDYVPPNRTCRMTHATTDALWIGYLHNHVSDEQLKEDVKRFLEAYAAEYVQDAVIQIVQSKYKKAHVHEVSDIPRHLVHQLNCVTFIEDGVERLVCVEDKRGSSGQKCPRWIASYCRGQNLRFTHPCRCSHPPRPTENAPYKIVAVDLESAKAEEIMGKFLSHAPFRGGEPKVVAIHAIQNDTLAKLHEDYRLYLRQKNGEEPNVRELYHGTNNRILEEVCRHGLRPPSDCKPSDHCPFSGGKGLTTTLCDTTCRRCIERHCWDRCHMFGLGVYLADSSAKSHFYVSQPISPPGATCRYRMILCSVLGRALEISGHLTTPDAMHDVPNIRHLKERLPCMIEPHESDGGVHDGALEKHDLLFVKGLGMDSQRGRSVINSEYIAFHPHQCMPKYLITYELV